MTRQSMHSPCTDSPVCSTGLQLRTAHKFAAGLALLGVAVGVWNRRFDHAHAYTPRWRQRWQEAGEHARQVVLGRHLRALPRLSQGQLEHHLRASIRVQLEAIRRSRSLQRTLLQARQAQEDDAEDMQWIRNSLRLVVSKVLDETEKVGRKRLAAMDADQLASVDASLMFVRGATVQEIHERYQGWVRYDGERV